MNRVRVVAVVVAYNGGDMLDRCVEALRTSLYVPLDVVVVDNASSDGCVDRLTARCDSSVFSLRLPDNRGFAAGVNAGIEFAKSRDDRRAADVYALVNQDCIVRPGWLGPLVDALLRDSTVAVAGSRIYEPDSVTLQHAGGVVFANGLTEHRGRGSRDPSAFREACDVDYVTGALCAFRADTWARIGPLDDAFRPVYYEEVDFCLRAREVGLRTVYVPQSEAVHFEASSLQRGSAVYLARYHRSRMRFAARHLLRSGSAVAALRSELAWLASQRSLGQIVPVLAAYARLPAELIDHWRSRRAVGLRS